MAYKRISAMPVIEGGTGVITHTTAYGVLCAGTTTTGPEQTVPALGSSGDVLTSQGAGSLPHWVTPIAGGVTSIAGTTNQITASATIGAVTLSIPNPFIAPGSIEATTTVKADTNFLLPTTSSTAGQLLVNSLRQLHFF